MDSLGSLVGYFADGWSNWAIVPVGDQFYRLMVSPAGFILPSPSTFYYEQADCRGPAYAFRESTEPSFIRSALKVDAGNAYVPGSDLQERVLASMTDPYASSGCSNILSVWRDYLVNVETVRLSGFVPPFRAVH